MKKNKDLEFAQNLTKELLEKRKNDEEPVKIMLVDGTRYAFALTESNIINCWEV